MNGTGELSGSTVALDTLADIDMLADCDALVLVLRSAVSRLSHHLAVARKQRAVPLISLQWPTSPSFKMKAKKNAGMLKSTRMMQGRGGGKVDPDGRRTLDEMKRKRRKMKFKLAGSPP